MPDLLRQGGVLEPGHHRRWRHALQASVDRPEARPLRAESASPRRRHNLPLGTSRCKPEISSPQKWPQRPENAEIKADDGRAAKETAPRLRHMSLWSGNFSPVDRGRPQRHVPMRGDARMMTREHEWPPTCAPIPRVGRSPESPGHRVPRHRSNELSPRWASPRPTRGRGADGPGSAGARVRHARSGSQNPR